MDDTIRAATPLQAGMVFHAITEPGSGVDVEHVVMEHDGEVDSGRLTDAWNETLAELAILRSHVRLIDGLPHIETARDCPIPIEVHDLRSAADVAAELRSLEVADRRSGFDLQNPPLMRLTVCQLPDARTWILWSFHHLLLDGRSFPLVLDRVLARLHGSTPTELPAADFFSYADALLTLDHTAKTQQWADKLQPIDGPSAIAAHAEPRSTGAPVEALERRLPTAQSELIRELAAQNDVSVNNVIQAAWALLLHHHSQQSDVIFGSTRAGRHIVPDSDEMIGLLILTVPFTVNLSPTDTTTDLLAAVRSEQKVLRELEAVPLEDIQRASGFGATPLFDSLVMYDEATLDTRMRSRLGTHAASWRFTYVGQTNYPLTLLAYGETEILLRLEYGTAYDDPSASRLLGRLERILIGMSSEPQLPAVGLPHLSEDDEARLEQWNQTGNTWDHDTTLLDLLKEQALRTPDAPAIRHGNARYSYRQFFELVTDLAAHLREQGVIPGVLVGVAAKRSIEMELSIHAIVAAGGGYVPLDPSLPDDRLAFMANDAQINLVLATPGLAERPAFSDLDVLSIDASSPTWPAGAMAPVPQPTSRDLAYALFTSGSTGTPKCAANDHRGIVNRIRWMQDAFPLDHTDVVLQKTPYSFDVSVWEHFWPLCVGAELVIADPGVHQDPKALVRVINESKVTTIHFVPSMLQLFVEESTVSSCTTLRRIIASGEALPRTLQDRVFEELDDTELHNLYGPTEAAIDVTWWACDPESPLPQIPIGKAIANTQIHVLDQQCNPVPPGVAGELHIGGVQVGRGYVNRPELTAERFLPDPFGYDEQIYKTGDLARFMPDGNVEYLGRLDHQVKIRGLRIELGEIEAVILGLDVVRETVVMAREDQPGNQQLVAYTVGEPIDVSVAKAHCARTLPNWMIPEHWVALDAFPLNMSGKVDRKQLPAPTFGRSASELPTTAVEARIAATWAEVLDHDGFGRRDVFFEVGGSSLALIRLAVLLSDELGRDVAVAELLRHTTIEAQATHVASAETGDDEAVVRGTELAEKQRAARSRRRTVRR